MTSASVDRMVEKHLPRIYGYTEVIYDTNIGTRARLPVCNPNPNRVKAKRKRDRGGGRHCLPVTTATARGGKKPHRSTAHDKEQKKSNPVRI